MPAASRTSRRPSTRRSVRVFALMGALVLVLAGCSKPGQVKDYNEQTQTNFLDACLAANANEGMSADAAKTACQCWYDQAKDTVDFDTFKQDEDNIRTALDKDELNSSDDLKRVAPTLYGVFTSTDCQPPSGPTAN